MKMIQQGKYLFDVENAEPFKLIPTEMQAAHFSEQFGRQRLTGGLAGDMRIICKGMHRFEDGSKPGTSTQVAIELVFNIFMRGVRVAAQQAIHSHDKTGRTIAAL